MTGADEVVAATPPPAPSAIKARPRSLLRNRFTLEQLTLPFKPAVYATTATT
jgi:hypothetical protein